MRQRKWFSLMVAGVLLLGLLGGAAGTAAAPVVPGEPPGIMFEVQGPGLVRAPATGASFLVVFGNADASERPAMLERVEVADSSGKLLHVFPVGKSRPSVARRVTGIDDLKAVVATPRTDAEHERREQVYKAAKDGLFGQVYRIDLKKADPNLTPGTAMNFRVTAYVRVGKSNYAVSRPLEIDYQGPLPQIGNPGGPDNATVASLDTSRPVSGEGFPLSLLDSTVQTALAYLGGWYPGDAHIHTAFSDAYFISVADRVQAAQDWGFGYLITSDHNQMMTASSWAQESTEVDQAQATYGLTVIEGGEMSTRKGDNGNSNDSHYLDYNTVSFVNNPDPETRDGQGIIDAVNAANPGNSFGVIAHPYNSTYPWTYWSATGYTGMELCSGLDKNPDPRDIAKWDQLLTAGLPNTLATGRFVVGTGNSDAHNFMFGEHLTYLYLPNYYVGNRRDVLNALRSGRAIVTSDGSVGVFTVNGATVGSIVDLPSGTPLTIKVLLKSVDSAHYVRQVKLVTAGGQVLRQIDIPGTLTSYQTTITINPGDPGYPTASTYIRLESAFLYDGWLSDFTWYSYANPIFIRK